MWLQRITIPIYGRKASWRTLRWGLWSESWLYFWKIRRCLSTAHDESWALVHCSKRVGTRVPSFLGCPRKKVWAEVDHPWVWQSRKEPGKPKSLYGGKRIPTQRQADCKGSSWSHNWIWCGPVSCCSGDDPKRALEQFRADKTRCVASSPEPDGTLPSIGMMNSKCGAVNKKANMVPGRK